MTLETIIARLKTQDNRATMHPMFCVQEQHCDVGYDSAYADNKCWHHSESGETIYDEEPEDLKDWDEFGYVKRWETVMAAFTEEGCKEYIAANGHNHRGQLRIYADSFRRCPEMIFLREWLLNHKT